MTPKIEGEKQENEEEKEKPENLFKEGRIVKKYWTYKRSNGESKRATCWEYDTSDQSGIEEAVEMTQRRKRGRPRGQKQKRWSYRPIESEDTENDELLEIEGVTTRNRFKNYLKKRNRNEEHEEVARNASESEKDTQSKDSEDVGMNDDQFSGMGTLQDNEESPSEFTNVT